jgi:osmotically-inducible protein OsmY
MARFAASPIEKAPVRATLFGEGVIRITHNKTHMKKVLIVAAAALIMAGCNRDNVAHDSAGAQKDAVEANKDAQKDALNAQKDAISKQAKEQKNAIDAQAKAEKEQINAQKDTVDAQAKAAKAQADAQAKTADAQNKAINESAGANTGAASASATTSGDSDSLIKARVRAALLGNTGDASNPASVSANPNAPKNLNVDISNGKVTLKGTVATEQAKMDCEKRAKEVQGVTAVDNQLEVKAQ